MDTLGLLLTVLITAASVQDRDGAKPLLWNLRRAFPSVTLVWADGGYAGKLVAWARTKLKPRLTLQIVKRPGDRTPSRCCPAAGSSSGPWLGSLAAAAPSATTNACPGTTKPSCTGR